MILANALSFCAFAGDKTFTFDEKLHAPKLIPTVDDDAFEKQFVIDTGATNCPQTQFLRSIRLDKFPAKDDLTFKFLLSKWPDDLQPTARLWIAIGVTNTIANDGSLGLNFSQNGTGMETDLNNSYNIGGMMILGCDYAYTNGEVTVKVQNKTHLPDVRVSVCAIAYVPKSDRATAKTSK